MTTDLLDGESLKRVYKATPGNACCCSLGACRSWESFTEDRWPNRLLQRIGTLRDQAIDEPTLEEFHPFDTRYGSADAPIDAAFFPYNRCEAYACSQCNRVLLRYTEYGGYYVDHRVREVLSELIV